MKPLIIQKNVKVITSREENSIDQYFKDISRIKLLTPIEEIELARRIKYGDTDALDKLIVSNLRFVVSVAKQYQNKGVFLLDLINEGNLGLIHAAKTFDETKGFRFISYAVYWIRQAILAALTEQSHIIHIPFNKFYLHSKIKKTLEEEKSKGNNVVEENLAEILKIAEEDIKDILNQSASFGYILSLDNTLSADDEKSTLVDVIENKNSKAPDEDLIKESMKKDLDVFINKVLDDREKEVISMNYGLGDFSPMSFQEIADRLGLTKECIRQIKERALRKLRLNGGNEKLRQYL